MGGAGALCSRVYVTEGRNKQLLDRLAVFVASSLPGCVLAHIHRDAEYNRTGFTLASYCGGTLANGAVELAKEAFREIKSGDFSAPAKHPRVGVVDHISFHPLPRAGGEKEGDLSAAASAARDAARRMGEQHQVPVHLYGQCHPEGRALAELRRQLGYFKSSGQSNVADSSVPSGGAVWSGGFGEYGGLEPDFGPAEPGELGVMCIGAVRWLVNFNVPLISSEIVAGRAIARGVSERFGGLPHVEAMALCHGSGMEIA